MEETTEQRIFSELEAEKRELAVIENQIALIRERLIDRVPDHFSKRDVLNAIFGSLTIGITFILKGMTVSTAVNLENIHLYLILAASLLVLIAEIYYIGYSRVKNKSQRHFGQFMTKRLITLYAISFFTSWGLVYLLNLNHYQQVQSFNDVVKIVVLVAFPCAVGAAIPSLLKKY
jgi:uncharacterized membrane protein